MMQRKKKLWSVPRITDARFPGYTLRIAELKGGGTLYAIHMMDGKQKMRSLKCTRADLGGTDRKQQEKARAIALDIIQALATGTDRASSQAPYTASSSNGTGSTLTFAALATAYEERGLFGSCEAHRKAYSRRVPI